MSVFGAFGNVCPIIICMIFKDFLFTQRWDLLFRLQNLWQLMSKVA